MFKSYTQENPPRRGKALKIWRELSTIPKFEMLELHYNPNCFGNAKNDGWGTWACHFRFEGDYSEQWCGWDNGAYLMGNVLPFRVVFAKTMIQSNEIGGGSDGHLH